MLTASCPKCAKQVTLPSAARPESRVRCPLCAEEYTLEGVFAELPPLLVLLDAPSLNGASGAHAGAPQALAASGSGVGGSSSIFDFAAREQPSAAAADSEADTAIGLAAAADVAPRTNAFDFGGGAATVGDAAGASLSTSARPKPKKKTSPVRSMIGVVLGGVVALPLAQMILWYLPGGWDVEKRDPMNIGRDYPTTFGILAPSWVKNAAVAVDDATVAGDPQPSPRDKPPRNAIDNLDPEASSFGRNELNHALTGGNSGNQPPKNNRKPPKNNDDAPLIVDDSGKEPAENLPPIDEPDFSEPPPPKSPVKNAPSFSPSDLAAELKTVKDLPGLLDTAVQPGGDGQSKREAAEQFLQAMSQLAKVVTFAAEKPAGHMEHVSALLSTAAEGPQKRKIVSTLASLEMTKPHSEPAGIIFMGTVREIQPRGPLFETVVETSTTAKKPVSVYTADDPQARLAVGDAVVVLGAIVEKPNKNITGYKGEPDPVIWGGHMQVVPAEE